MPSDRTSDSQQGGVLSPIAHTHAYLYTIFALVTTYALRYRLQLQTWNTRASGGSKSQKSRPYQTTSHHRTSRFSATRDISLSRHHPFGDNQNDIWPVPRVYHVRTIRHLWNKRLAPMQANRCLVLFPSSFLPPVFPKLWDVPSVYGTYNRTPCDPCDCSRHGRTRLYCVKCHGSRSWLDLPWTIYIHSYLAHTRNIGDHRNRSPP